MTPEPTKHSGAVPLLRLLVLAESQATIYASVRLALLADAARDAYSNHPTNATGPHVVMVHYVLLAFRLAAALGCYVLQRHAARGFVVAPVAELKASKDNASLPLGGRLAVVTGGNAGLGYETAIQLAELGCAVIVASRNEQRGLDAANAIRKRLPFAVVYALQIDLSSTDSVAAFAARFPALERRVRAQQDAGKKGLVVSDDVSLDFLINNGGLFSKAQSATKEGQNVMVATNHLGGFALTQRLLPFLRRGGDTGAGGRVVNVSSVAHTWAAGVDYAAPSLAGRRVAAALQNTFTRPASVANPYGLSKMCNRMHAHWLAKREREVGGGVVAVAVHPGFVMTDIFRELGFAETAMRYLIPTVHKTPWEGAQSTLHCCIAPVLQNARDGSRYVAPGGYYADCVRRDGTALSIAADDDECEAVAEWSMEQCGLKGRAQ
jgi:NAD(P)-dependent dehydrogenase (short-subunit alcohol dehydrogenase family)